jgi:hypothetical protein
MKSLRADALRLILPLLARGAIVDRFGVENEVDLVDVDFVLEEVLLVDRDEDDDERLDERDDEG